MSWIMDHLGLELFHLGDSAVTPLTLIVFGVTVLLTLLIANALRGFVARVLTKGRPEQAGMAYAVGRILQYALIIAGVLVGLENVGVSLTAFAALGAVISVGIGFGLQNITQNFVSGVILLIERPVQQGDVIQLANGTAGRIDEIGMRATRIVTADGIGVLVPNSALITEQVQNFHAPALTNRIRVRVGVAYGSDTALVRAALLEVANLDERVLHDPAPEVLLSGFGDSALDFDLAVWLPDANQRVKVASDLRFAIDAVFRERGIAIPFPQRDVHIVSGGEALGLDGA